MCEVRLRAATVHRGSTQEENLQSLSGTNHKKLLKIRPSWPRVPAILAMKLDWDRKNAGERRVKENLPRASEIGAGFRALFPRKLVGHNGYAEVAEATQTNTVRRGALSFRGVWRLQCFLAVC